MLIFLVAQTVQTNFGGQNIYRRQKLILSPCTTKIKKSRRRENENILISLRRSVYINGVITGSFGGDLACEAKQRQRRVRGKQHHC